MTGGIIVVGASVATAAGGIGVEPALSGGGVAPDDDGELLAAGGVTEACTGTYTSGRGERVAAGAAVAVGAAVMACTALGAPEPGRPA